MPVLTYFAAHEGITAERVFSEFPDTEPYLLEVRDWDGGALPDAEQAVIARSAVYQVAVLIPVGGEGVRVNGRRVVGLRVLRQGSLIQIGGLRLRYWELTLQTVADGSPLVGKRCPVCRIRFNAGDEVMICPRCKGPHHKGCYLEHDYCPDMAGCLYPVRATLKHVLAAHNIHTERLAANSDLVVRREKCPANTPLDQEPFHAEATVVYCPKCEAAFHLECWVHLDQCPKCGAYDVAEALRDILMPGRS